MTDQVKKPKTPKVKKVAKEVACEPLPPCPGKECEEKAVIEPFVQTNEAKPKKRGPRAKKVPTKEEEIAKLKNELQQVEADLKDLKGEKDELCVLMTAAGKGSVNFPYVCDLIEGELEELEEGKEELNQGILDLTSEPCEA